MGRDGAGSLRLGESVKPTVLTDTPPPTLAKGTVTSLAIILPSTPRVF